MSKLPCTIVEWLVMGAFLTIGTVILACLGSVGWLVYYLLTSPAVQTWLGY